MDIWIDSPQVVLDPTIQYNRIFIDISNVHLSYCACKQVIIKNQRDITLENFRMSDGNTGISIVNSFNIEIINSTFVCKFNDLYVEHSVTASTDSIPEDQLNVVTSKETSFNNVSINVHIEYEPDYPLHKMLHIFIPFELCKIQAETYHVEIHGRYEKRPIKFNTWPAVDSDFKMKRLGNNRQAEFKFSENGIHIVEDARIDPRVAREPFKKRSKKKIDFTQDPSLTSSDSPMELH
jgi:hypothetical protein